jgi:hypothetical protein
MFSIFLASLSEGLAEEENFQQSTTERNYKMNDLRRDYDDLSDETALVNQMKVASY